MENIHDRIFRRMTELNLKQTDLIKGSGASRGTTQNLVRLYSGFFRLQFNFSKISLIY